MDKRLSLSDGKPYCKQLVAVDGVENGK